MSGLEATPWIIYRWDCPACGEENELQPGLDLGETEECVNCEAVVEMGDPK